MDLTLIIELIAFVILMGLSGFFSSSETAFFSLNAIQLEQMRRDEDTSLDRIKRMLSEPRRLIVTILIGNEFVNVAASVISAAIVIQLFGAENKYVNLFIMVPILLLVGEITPKTLALRNNVAFASFQAAPIRFFAKLITPLRWFIRVVSDAITTLIIGKQRTRGSLVTEDMLRTIAHEAVQEGVVDHHEARFIDQLFDLSHKSVAEIMIPRSAIFYLPVEMPLSEIVAELIRTRLTRVPVYKGNRDTVVGMLYARDLLRVDYQAAIEEGKTVEAFLREPFLVPEVKPAAELFDTFRERSLTVAMTVDEFGGITGLITMEDLLKHIFGHIRTLSDAARIQGIEYVGDGRFAIDGNVSIDEFNREMNSNLSSEHAHIIAGLVLNAYGELPPKNALVKIGDFRFIVDEVDHYRIQRVLCEPKEVKVGEKEIEIERATATVEEKTAPASASEASEESAQKSEALESATASSESKEA